MFSMSVPIRLQCETVAAIGTHAESRAAREAVLRRLEVILAL